MTLDRYHDLLDGTEAWDELAKNKWEFAAWLKDLIFDIIVDHPHSRSRPESGSLTPSTRSGVHGGRLDVPDKKLRSIAPWTLLNALVAIGGVR